MGHPRMDLPRIFIVVSDSQSLFIQRPVRVEHNHKLVQWRTLMVEQCESLSNEYLLFHISPTKPGGSKAGLVRASEVFWGSGRSVSGGLFTRWTMGPGLHHVNFLCKGPCGLPFLPWKRFLAPYLAAAACIFVPFSFSKAFPMKFPIQFPIKLQNWKCEHN